MGAQRVLQAADRRLSLGLGVAILATLGAFAPAVAAPRERVAVIDLGPADEGQIRQQVAARIVAGGLEAVVGDGVEDALAGVHADLDAVQLAAALGEAQRTFGALDCGAATTASQTAIGIGAARQAAGLVVPELSRAWSYVLLCADRGGDVDGAMRAAARLRALGGSTEIPADVLARYPEVDAMLDHDRFPIEIKAAVDGAEIWIDFQRAGVSPLRTFVSSGEHVIAAAAGTRRGWAAGTAVRAQPVVTVPMPDQATSSAKLARRVAAWNGVLPAPAELADVLEQVNARIALVRRGDTLEAWGHVGRSAPPIRLGGEDGRGTLAETDRLIALIQDRVLAWNDRAPDPDQPLLVEDPKDRRGHGGKADEPTRWWVYAAIIGAVATGAGIVYLHDAATNTQRVELHQP